MTITQIIAFFFGLFMAYLTFLNFKKNVLNRYQFIIWEFLFVSFIIVVLLPDKFDYLLAKLGIARAFDLFSIIAFVIILFLTFHNYLLLSKLEKKIEDRVRTKAIENIKNKV